MQFLTHIDEPGCSSPGLCNQNDRVFQQRHASGANNPGSNQSTSSQRLFLTVIVLKSVRGKLLVDDQTFSSMLGRSVPSADSLRPFHLNSSLGEIGETFLGNLVKEQVSKAFKKQMGANSADPTLEKMFQEMANDMPLRSLVLFSGGKLGFRSVSILISLLNLAICRRD